MIIIGLFTAFALLLLSLLVILPAPTYHLWKLTIVATELGHYLAVIVILTGFFIPYLAVLVLLTISFTLFIYPALMAFFISFHLKERMEKQLGFLKKPVSIHPFSVMKLFFPGEFNKEYKTYIYKQIEGNELVLDFYSPTETQTKNPLIVVIHGGAWSSGNNRDFKMMNQYFASEGFAVASITYRLAPEYIYPAQTEDVNDAIKFLKDDYNQFNIDHSRIFLLGRSAGGQIALKVAYNAPANSFRGVIAIYTPADMVWGYAMPGNPLILDSRKVLADYLGGSYQEVKANFHAANCVEGISNNCPPTLMIHGRRDEMVAYEHNLHLIPQLEKYKVPNYLLTIPWGTHGCDYFFNSPSAQLSTYAIHYFLNRYSW